MEEHCSESCLCVRVLSNEKEAVKSWLKHFVDADEINMEMEEKAVESFLEEWRRFMSNIGSNEMWIFRSGSKSWSCLAGREGYAIIDKDGNVIDYIVTMLN